MPKYRFANRPFYEVASTEELDQLSAIDRERVENFARDGFLRLDTRIDPDVIDAAAEYVKDQCFDSTDASLVQPRMIDAWTRNDAIRSIALNETVLSCVSTLYGRAPIPFQTLNFPVGSGQRTHSDGIHFNTVPSRFMCGVWVALEDINEDSGPLHYYAGSHRLPDYQLYDIFDGQQEGGNYPALEDYNACYEDFAEQTMRREGLERREICLKKGEVFIWSASLFHGGSPVTNPASTRMSQVTHIFFDECVYYTPRRSHPQVGRLWLRQITDIGKGRTVDHVFAGRRFIVNQPGPFSLLDESRRGNAVALQETNNASPLRQFVRAFKSKTLG